MEGAVDAMGLEGLVCADGIDQEEAWLVGITDVLGNRELERKLSVMHAVATTIDGVGTVFIGKGLVERRVITTTGDGLFLVAHCQGGQAIEPGLALDMALDGDHRTGLQLDGCA